MTPSELNAIERDAWFFANTKTVRELVAYVRAQQRENAALRGMIADWMEYAVHDCNVIDGAVRIPSGLLSRFGVIDLDSIETARQQILSAPLEAGL